MAVFAQGVGILCNYSAVTGSRTDLDSILSIAARVRTTFPDFDLKARKSL
jgi:hypothetical protein